MSKDFSSIEDERVKLIWHSEPVKERRIFSYTSCSVNEHFINIGDNVLVKQCNGGFAVAKVIKLFEDVGENPFRAKIKWFYKYSEIPKKIRLAWEMQGNKELGEDEVFEISEDSSLSPYEEIDAETIYKSCLVETIPVDFMLQRGTPENDKFYMRYKLCKTGLVRIIDPFNQPVPSLPHVSVVLDQSSKLKIVSGSISSKDNSESKIVSSSNRLKGSSGLLKTPIINMECKVHKTEETDKETKKIPTKRKAKEALFKDTQLEKCIFTNNTLVKKVYSTEEVINKVHNEEDDEVLSDISESDASSVCSFSNQPLQSPNIVIARDNLLKYTAKLGLIQNSGSRQSKTFTLITEKDKVSTINATNSKKKKESENFLFNENVEVEQPVTKLPRSNKKGKINKENFKVENDQNDSVTDLANCELLETNDDDYDQKKPLKGRKKKISCINIKVVKSQSKKLVTNPLISERNLMEAKTPLEKARQRLHVSAVPDCLPCRETEFETIFAYILSRLQEHSGGCMYISGVPGTGKTATVHEVIRRLKSDYSDMVPYFKFIELNGMKLTDPNQAYCTILKLLTGQKATPDHAATLLEKKFCNKDSKKDHIVILVDELDLLWTRKQNIMYNLFDWPTRQHSQLVILAVANTMDLPERVMMNRVSSRLGLTRITFQPYNFRQLQEIVLSRITGIEAFEEHALQLVARKVAAVSGDARRCLDICRRAVEIAEASYEKKNLKMSKGIVGMNHVELALKEMFSSPKILALQSLSAFEVLFMKAVISEFHRTGLEEALFFEVFEQFRSHCQLEGFSTPNASQTFAICTSLSTCKFLLVELGYKDIYQRIRLNVNKDDVIFAFKSKEKN